MEMDLRVMRPEERLYSYRQSMDISMRSGLIGHLRADFGSSGYEFYSTWNDFNMNRKTQEFKNDLDEVVNALREDAKFGNILCGRNGLSKYCWSHMDSQFEEGSREFGFRVNTENYSYMLRLNPDKGAYNAYIYCYERKWLDKHMENAERGIRFIDSHYNDLFRLPDGEKIKITDKDGHSLEYTCRYVGETHMECGNNLYHICEFAERMEQAGNTVEPVKPIIPAICYSILPSSGEVIQIRNGEAGYYPTRTEWMNDSEKKDYVMHQNRLLGVSKAQEAAMLAGSMFGWNVPAADPRSYDKDGKPKPPSRKADLNSKIADAQSKAQKSVKEGSSKEQER